MPRIFGWAEWPGWESGQPCGKTIWSRTWWCDGKMGLSINRFPPDYSGHYVPTPPTTRIYPALILWWEISLLHHTHATPLTTPTKHFFHHFQPLMSISRNSPCWRCNPTTPAAKLDLMQKILCIAYFDKTMEVTITARVGKAMDSRYMHHHKISHRPLERRWCVHSSPTSEDVLGHAVSTMANQTQKWAYWHENIT